MQNRSLRLAELGDVILSPWASVVWLALESSEVIGLRVVKLSGGGVDAQHEAHVIVSEKVDAVFEVTARLLSGATAIHVIGRFREQVAANARRLSADYPTNQWRAHGDIIAVDRDGLGSEDPSHGVTPA